MKNSFVIEYLNENEFRKKEIELKEFKEIIELETKSDEQFARFKVLLPIYGNNLISKAWRYGKIDYTKKDGTVVEMACKIAYQSGSYISIKYANGLESQKSVNLFSIFNTYKGQLLPYLQSKVGFKPEKSDKDI